MKKEKLSRNVKREGFTLVGVLIALTIIIVGMFLMMNTFRLAIRGIRTSKRRVEGLQVAQEAIESYVIGANYNDSALDTTTHDLGTTDGFDLSYRVWNVKCDEVYTAAGGTECKRIKVTVEDNRDIVGDITLKTLKTDFQN